jgi:hypothetical protein
VPKENLMNGREIWKGLRQIGHWKEPWNRGVWDYCLWQVKWENIMLRMLLRARKDYFCE